MTLKEMKEAIAQRVTELQGCKAMELCAMEDLVMGCRQSALSSLPDIIEEMVLEKMLVEVEYILPGANYRIKSFLLPKGTELTIDYNDEAM